MVVRLMYLTAVRVFGWFDGGWTLANVATVIRRRFVVVYRYLPPVASPLHQRGFTVQRPARRAIEPDEQAVTGWREHTWAGS
jgi:transposase